MKLLSKETAKESFKRKSQTSCSLEEQEWSEGGEAEAVSRGAGGAPGRELLDKAACPKRSVGST